MHWGEQKKFTYTSIFLIFVLVVVAFFFINFTPPSCSDGEQNQKEEGIDCGGECTTVCSFSTSDLSVDWARSFEVSNGIYNSIVYIKNLNLNMRAEAVPYIFKLYDEKNILVYERKGRVDILPESVLVVFEPTINTGKRVPKRTTFEFPFEVEWIKDFSPKLETKTKNLKIENTRNNQLQISASILNTSLNEIRNLKMVIILFGKDGNAINSSKTVIDRIQKDSEQEINFTWPNLSQEDIIRVEILPVDYEIIEM